MSTILIQHYHFRPGGVRSVIERGVAEWNKENRWDRVILVSGEPIDEVWGENFKNLLPGVKVDWLVHKGIGYTSEQAMVPRGELERAWTDWLERFRPELVWAHNLSVGRNGRLGLALGKCCQAAGVPLLCHHHDWWTDQRWQRWAEFAAEGLDSLDKVAESLLPTGPGVRHACVHPRDARILEHYFGNQVSWIPNPTVPPRQPSAAEMAAALERLGGTSFWLAPCRILRRKNLLEAVALTRLLRPTARFLITGKASSAGEQPYAKAVSEAAAAVGLNFTSDAADSLSVTVPALLAQAEVVIQTSVQEGFGLPTLEAAQFHKPLLVRRLPEITTWLEAQGGRFPNQYDDLLLPERFISPTERTSNRNTWETIVIPRLPKPWQAMAKSSVQEMPPTFSGLSVHGQLDLLGNWAQLESALLEANPWLADWRKPEAWPPAQAGEAKFDWPAAVERLLESECPNPAAPEAAVQAMEALFRATLPDASKFPLLW